MQILRRVLSVFDVRKHKARATPPGLPPMFPGSRGPDPPRGGYCLGPGGVVFRFFSSGEKKHGCCAAKKRTVPASPLGGSQFAKIPGPSVAGSRSTSGHCVCRTRRSTWRGCCVTKKKAPTRAQARHSCMCVSCVIWQWVSCCVALSCVRCSSFVCFHLPQYWDGRNAVTSPRGMQSLCACHGFVPFVEVSFHESFFCRCMD